MNNSVFGTHIYYHIYFWYIMFFFSFKMSNSNSSKGFSHKNCIFIKSFWLILSFLFNLILWFFFFFFWFAPNHFYQHKSFFQQFHFYFFCSSSFLFFEISKYELTRVICHCFFFFINNIINHLQISIMINLLN